MVARETGHVAVISVGWDPGMFSVSRVYANAIMPNGADYTFWGRGVSQGAPDAIRRIPRRGRRPPVHGARARALEAVRSGANPELTTRQKHTTRECFVVAEEGADTAAIEEAIVTMPNYFADFTPRSPSFLRKSSTAITPAFPTAARSSALAPRVPPARTPT